jgi:ParB family chromosome partitioning protein
MSQSAICHHLRLLSLPRDVQRLISEGALSMGHGKVLAGVSDANDAIEAALECISENKSVREFEAWLSGTRGEVDRRASRRSSKKRREERELKNGLFLIIKERHNEAGSGMIEIPYYCEDDKKWVLDALSGHGTSKLAKNLKQTSVAMSVHGGSRGQPSSLAQDAIA